MTACMTAPVTDGTACHRRLVLTFDEGKLAILVRNYCSGAP